jgi:hypothetical protein
VKVGEQAAAIINSPSTQEIVITVPPKSPGPLFDPGAVDVSIVHGDGSMTTAIAALDYYDPSWAKTALTNSLDEAFFEPVVFPTLVSGAGAFGSQWRTDVAIRNDNDLPLPSVSSLFGNVAARSTLTLSGASAPGGAVAYVSRQFTQRLSFNAFVRDFSREVQGYGTEMPVLREKDLFGRPFSILMVPTDAKYRTALRILRTDGYNTVALRVYADGSEPLVDTNVQLRSHELSYASLVIDDLVRTFPQLAGKSPLRVVIDPSSTFAGTWAFVSVTNNETQNVTIISPH